MRGDYERKPEDDRGRCAEHPGEGIHERTDDCRRFMTLAFMIDLGLEPPEA
jgi:hypothetical protein